LLFVASQAEIDLRVSQNSIENRVTIGRQTTQNDCPGQEGIVALMNCLGKAR
jgi:hypothetical protein